VRRHRSVHKRLAELREEVGRLREALKVLDEQVAYQQSVADDAEVRAMVAGTPLADRQRQEAAGDLHRLARERREVAGRLARLAEEQDGLLDRLLEGPAADGGRGEHW
jgi:cell division septum initiation protein DivIVA